MRALRRARAFLSSTVPDGVTFPAEAAKARLNPGEDDGARVTRRGAASERRRLQAFARAARSAARGRRGRRWSGSAEEEARQCSSCRCSRGVRLRRPPDDSKADVRGRIRSAGSPPPSRRGPPPFARLKGAGSASCFALRLPPRGPWPETNPGDCSFGRKRRRCRASTSEAAGSRRSRRPTRCRRSCSRLWADGRGFPQLVGAGAPASAIRVEARARAGLGKVARPPASAGWCSPGGRVLLTGGQRGLGTRGSRARVSAMRRSCFASVWCLAEGFDVRRLRTPGTRRGGGSSARAVPENAGHRFAARGRTWRRLTDTSSTVRRLRRRERVDGV